MRQGYVKHFLILITAYQNPSLMFKQKVVFSVIFLGLTLSYYSGKAFAEGFKSSNFLTYPQATQKNYISTSAMMAGVIATQNNSNQATCIDSWIAKHRKNAFQATIDIMKKYPDYHPQGVILGILQKACGSFKYKN